jgi:hypothetical protein
MWRVSTLIVVAAAFVPVVASAHDLSPKPERELVRIQGYRAPAPAGNQVDRELKLVVLGQPMQFAATEWRTFAFYDATGAPTPAEPTQMTLQGERALLHRITSARPEQRITVLAERRPGSADLFVLTVDLCP